jgi:hypothetical protein
MLLVDEAAIAVAATHFTRIACSWSAPAILLTGECFTLPSAPKLERLASVLDVSTHTSLDCK